MFYYYYYYWALFAHLANIQELGQSEKICKSFCHNFQFDTNYGSFINNNKFKFNYNIIKSINKKCVPNTYIKIHLIPPNKLPLLGLFLNAPNKFVLLLLF